MKSYIDFIMRTILLLSVSSCANSQHKVAELAKSHLEQSVDNPKQLNIISKLFQGLIFIGTDLLLNTNKINRLFYNCIIVWIGSSWMQSK